MANELEARVLRKVTWRIIPFVMLLYFVAFIDRVNIGFAALTMNKDIGLSPAVFPDRPPRRGSPPSTRSAISAALPVRP